MPTINLGRRELDALTREQAALCQDARRAVTYYDAKLSGFGVRFHATGKAAFILEYRPIGGGRKAGKKRLTIGAPETMKLETAKEAARDMLARIRLGADPAAERQAQRGAETVAELFDAYLREYCEPKLKRRTAELYAAYVRRYIKPELGTRKAEAITDSDVARLHRKIGAHKAPAKARPGAANRVLVFVSGCYSWASGEGKKLPKAHPNPAKGIKRFPENPRERYLSDAELARLGEALRLAETTGIPWTPKESPNAKHAPKPKNRLVTFDPWAIAAIRLLMFTGCRLREILHLRWADVDLERGFLFLPDSKTGAKPIYLNAPALDILNNLQRVGVYVIAGESAGTKDEKPRADLQRPWARVIEHAGLTGLRIHDLRHTFASNAAASGASLLVIGRLLGHRDIETTSRYAHLADDPVRAANDKTGARMKAAMERREAQVVPLREGAVT